MLRGAAYEVDEAPDGAQGADLGAKGAYDVVRNRPQDGAIDGLAVLRGVKEAQAMTEVIVHDGLRNHRKRSGGDCGSEPSTTSRAVHRKTSCSSRCRRRSKTGGFWPGAAFASEFRERYGFENIVGAHRPFATCWFAS